MHKLLLTTALLALFCGIACSKEKDPKKLENTYWQLKKLVDGNPAESVPYEVVITVRLAAGKLTGSGGCNDYGADYIVTGDHLSVAVIWATKRGCAAGKWETRYFEALQASESWKISGNTLTVQTADGSLVFTGQ